MKYVYALHWPNGYCMRTLPSGRQIEYCIPYRFESKEEREAWIANGENGMRSSNYREATRRRDLSAAVDRARKVADSYDLPASYDLWDKYGKLQFV